MAEIDPSIVSGLKMQPFLSADPFEQYGKVMNLNNLAGQGALQQYQLKSAQLADLRAQSQFATQQQVMSMFPGMLKALSGQPQATMPYQGKTDGMVESDPNAPPMTPQEYFGNVSRIPNEDPHKKDALEAGYQQWPNLRPQVANPAAANNVSPSVSIGQFGASMGLAGLPGSDSVMKLADLYKPQDHRGGSWSVNPSTGQQQFYPSLPEGMTPQGVAPGMEDYWARKALSSLNPAEATKTYFETGIMPGQSGSSAPQPAPAQIAPTGAAANIPPSVQSAIAGAAPSTEGMTPQGKADAAKSSAIKQQELRATSLNAERESYAKSAQGAAEALPDITLMKDALAAGLKTGATASTQLAIQKYAQDLGLPFSGDITNALEFQKGTVKLVAEITKSVSSREAVQGMMFLKTGNADLDSTVELNKKVIALAEGTKQWEIARDEAAQKYAYQHNGSIEGFAQQFIQQNPVHNFWQKSYDSMAGVGATNRQINQLPFSGNPSTSQATSSANVPLSNAQGWPLHQDANGNRAYVSPDGKQFKQVP